MDTNELKKCFCDHFDYIKEVISRVVFFTEREDYKLCKKIGDALVCMTEAGEKDIAATAAAMYYLATVYDDHQGAFSLNTAIRLLFEHDAINRYFDLLKEIFFDILDEYHYDELYSLPAIHLMEALVNKENPSEDDE